MQLLTPEQDNLLIALYRASAGRAEHYCPAQEDDLPLLESLLHKGLLKLEVEAVDAVDHWFAGLTDEGVDMAEEILSRPKMLGVQIEFDLNNPDQSALVKKLGGLEGDEIPHLLAGLFSLEQSLNRGSKLIEFDLNNAEQSALAEKLAEINQADVADVLAGLFGLHQSLQRGEIDALLTVYPDAVQTIRRMVQAGFEAELMTHEQQRIDQLLEEVSSLKSMLAGQNGVSPKVVSISEDDSAPIPVKPVTLKPVLPRSPEGQPKQLTVPQFDLPSDGDEESEDLFVVRKDEEAGRRASQNFIESLQKLQK